MSQRFGPWDDALNREFLHDVKAEVYALRNGRANGDEVSPEEAIERIGELIDTLEGEWEDKYRQEYR